LYRTIPRRSVAVLTALACLLAPAVAGGEQTLFRDDFTGTRLKPAWRVQSCGFASRQTPGVCPAGNVQLDGHGHLLLRGTPGTGALVGTFVYQGTTWPVPRRRVSVGWRTPFTFTVRQRPPASVGWAPGMWLHQLDAGRNVAELDLSEVRTALPWQAEAFHHVWRTTGGAPRGWRGCKGAAPHWSCGATLTGVRTAGVWRTYTVRIARTATTYLVDGRVVLRAPGVPDGRWFGGLAQLFPGRDGSWIAGDPVVRPALGPRVAFDVHLIDSVRVFR
jgi:hypothetical protein